MKKTFFSIIAAALLASCTTSQSALGDLRQLSSQIQIEGSTYGVSEWKQTANRYYKIDKKIAHYVEKDAYSNAELEEIGELQGQCVSGFARGVGQNITNKVQNATTIIKGLTKGLGF